MNRRMGLGLAVSFSLATGAALAAERVGFRSPKEVADEAIGCLKAAKALEGGERRPARYKCLAARRQQMSEFRTAKKHHKVLRAGYKVRVKQGIARCKADKKKLNPAVIKVWQEAMGTWTKQMDTYLKQGGERPIATPPELPADVCK